MKYKIIEWLFGWMFTSWIHLTPIDIVTAIVEFWMLCLIVKAMCVFCTIVKNYFDRKIH